MKRWIPLVVLMTAAVVFPASVDAQSTGGSSAGGSAERAAPSDASEGSEQRQPSEPAPRNLSADALTQAQALRQALGLRHDRPYVRETFERPAHHSVVTGDGTYGLNVTRRELEIVRARNALDSETAELTIHAEKIAPHDYAGTVVGPGGPDGGGVAVVLFKGDADAHAQELRRQVPAELRDNVATRSVRFSLEELRSEALRTGDVVAQLKAEGEVISAGINERTNSIELALPDLSSERQERVRARLGIDAVTFVQGEEAHPQHSGHYTRDTQFGPIQGGLHIHSGNNNGCTSAFATSGYYGQYFLTAGHCFFNGTTITQGGRTIGTVHNRTYGGSADVDAEMVGSVPYSMIGRIFLNYNTWYGNIHAVLARNSDSVGNIVCMSGRQTPGSHSLSENCGELIARFVQLPYGGSSCYCFRQISNTAIGGDSGSPYYWNTVYGRLATGIHSGGVEGFGNHYYTHLPYALERWGLTVMTN